MYEQGAPRGVPQRRQAALEPRRSPGPKLTEEIQFGPSLQNDGAIAQDWACKRCGYNLRGLTEAGFCPECGTPVGKSTTGDLLRFSDPDWIATVSRGMNIMVVMIFVSIPLPCIAGAVGSTPGARSIGEGIGILINLVTIYGIWLLTEPDPSGIGEDTHMNARRIVRAAVAGGAILGAVTWALQSSGSPSLWPMVVVASVASGLIGLVEEYFKFKFYEYLALRVPDERLARRARFLRIAMVVALALVLIAGIATLVLATRGGANTGPAGAPSAPGGTATFAGRTLPVPAGLRGVLLACAAVGGFLGLIFSLLTLFLLLRLRRRLSEQAEQARSIWRGDAVAARPA